MHCLNGMYNLWSRNWKLSLLPQMSPHNQRATTSRSISLLSLLTQTSVLSLSHSTGTCGCSAYLRGRRCGAGRSQAGEGTYFLTNHWSALQEGGCYGTNWQKALAASSPRLLEVAREKARRKGALSKQLEEIDEWPSWVGKPHGEGRASFQSLGPAGTAPLAIQGLLCSHKLSEETAPGTVKMLEPAVVLETWKLPGVTEHQDGSKYGSKGPLLIWAPSKNSDSQTEAPESQGEKDDYFLHQARIEMLFWSKLTSAC